MSLILDGTNGLSDVDGTAATPAVRGTDTNTGIFFPAADTIAFAEGGTEVARIDSSGNLGVGTTNPSHRLNVRGVTNTDVQVRIQANASNDYNSILSFGDNVDDSGLILYSNFSNHMRFDTNNTERMRIDSSGNLLVAKTTAVAPATVGVELGVSGYGMFTRASDTPLFVNRNTNDGELVSFRQDNTQEGTISVSGTTVSYNGGHLSRWSQLPDNSKDDTILKGTVLTNLDDMCAWTKDGELLTNEQLNKMKVSDVEGDTNVAGVFVNWTRDEDCNSDDMNVAMTGDMIIRIADGVVVQKGDLLMSAGDGTAKPQGDDIVRSKTIAKVTSNHVTCTYEDGSYCVPCVLMAC